MISAMLRGVEQKSIISLSVSFNLVTDLVTFSSLVTKLRDKEGLLNNFPVIQIQNHSVQIQCLYHLSSYHRK